MERFSDWAKSTQSNRAARAKSGAPVVPEVVTFACCQPQHFPLA
jgi:hypothetical protein